MFKNQPKKYKLLDSVKSDFRILMKEIRLKIK